MAVNLPFPKKEDFEQCDWLAVLEDNINPLCRDYAFLYGKSGNHAQESGDKPAQAVYFLLSAIASFRIDSSGEGLFLPLGSGGASFDDLKDEHLTVLSEIEPSITDSELRARVLDILLTREVGAFYNLAVPAIESYLVSAERLLDVYNNQPSLLRYNRAMTIAVRLGQSNNICFSKCESAILELLKTRSPNEDSSFCFSLSKLLFANRNRISSVPSNLAALAEQAATFNEANQNFWLARDYWVISAKWHESVQNDEKRIQALTKAAECWVKLAEKTPMQASAASLYRSAIEAYRKIPGTEERRKELHHLLIEAGEKSLAEMGTFSTDLTNVTAIQEAKATVSGLPFPDAVAQLALLDESPSTKELKARALEMAGQSPLTAIIGAKVVNSMGKVIAEKPAATKDAANALSYTIHEVANYYRAWSVVNRIGPAIFQIREENRNIELSDLGFLIEKNLFIPPGRTLSYALGLHAGFKGDYLLAAHILMPQVENSLRFLLHNKGVITSGLDQYGIQQEYNANTILKNTPELRAHIVDILGDALTFSLEGLLVDARGANLRNDVAHGLLNDSAYETLPVIYSWWLVLHICVRFYLDTQNEERGDGP